MHLNWRLDNAAIAMENGYPKLLKVGLYLCLYDFQIPGHWLHPIRYAQYDPAARRLNYVNAGHNPPLLFKNSERCTDVIRLEAGGTVIGLFEHFAFEQGTVTLEPGDLFAAFTDGITETMNPADEEWGEAHLIRTLQGCDGLMASEIIPNVMDAADGFAGGAKQHDDMTLVVLRLTAD
jgi:sigma-B regulation protein RsbU (phosphoserine phosphatase)